MWGSIISGHPLDKFRLEVDHLCAKDGLARLDNMEREKGKMLTFGGLITAAEHRISKSGRPWGFFALEDYHGAHEFRCFGEDYVRFGNMVEGWMVMVTTHVKEQGYGREALEAKLQAIELLSEARASASHGFAFKSSYGHRRGVGGRVHHLSVGPSRQRRTDLGGVRRRQKARHAEPQFKGGVGRRVRGQARSVVYPWEGTVQAGLETVRYVFPNLAPKVKKWRANRRWLDLAENPHADTFVVQSRKQQNSWQ